MWDVPAAADPVLPDLPEHIGRRLVEEHLLDPERFWLPFPVPSVSAADPTFSVHDTAFGIRRYWRGPTWINAAWLAPGEGLSRRGTESRAVFHGDTLRKLLGQIAALDTEGDCNEWCD